MVSQKQNSSSDNAQEAARMTTLPQSTLYSMLMLWASHNVSDLKAPVLPCCDSKQFRPCEQALAHILQTISEALLAIIMSSAQSG